MKVRPKYQRETPRCSQLNWQSSAPWLSASSPHADSLSQLTQSTTFQPGDTTMFVKTSIALAVIVALASNALAAPRVHEVNGPKITLPSQTPEGNRAGWFSER